MVSRQAHPQSFEDHNFFPAFSDCPDKDTWDDRYLQNTDPDNLSSPGVNRKHWCLLGEIIQADTFLRPRIVAKDYRGASYVVAFYPDNPDDMPRILQHFKIGNTIAIFYALRHYFLDGSSGVRVEETDEVLIMPLKMNEVLAMNREVIQYAPVEGVPQKCHGCDEVKEGLNKCAGCTLFLYCNKECQTKAWKEKEHKRFCKTLQDKNVRWMHFINYGVHDGASLSFT